MKFRYFLSSSRQGWRISNVYIFSHAQRPRRGLLDWYAIGVTSHTC